MEEGIKGTPFVTPPVQVYEVAPVPFKVTDDPEQIVVDGEAVAPTDGNGFTVTETEEDKPLLHEFVAATIMLPEPEANLTVMEVVFCPEVMIAPAGTVHI